MPNQPRQYHLGLVTSRDPTTLRDGELQVATGCEYRIGSPHMYKLPGRMAVGNALGAAVVALNKVQYDTGVDKLVAVANGTVYGSLVSTTPTFTSEGLTGLTVGAVPTFGAYEDRWVMTNGVDPNYLREPANVPGTSSPWRRILQTPPDAPTTTVIVAPSVSQRATTVAGGTYTNPDNATDATTGVFDTYATGTTNSGGPASVTQTWKFTANVAGTGRYLFVAHRGASSSGHQAFGPAKTLGDGGDSGNEVDSGAAIHVIEYTLDYTMVTPVWVTLYTGSRTYSQTVSQSIALVDGTDITNKLAIRATLTNVGGGPNHGYVYDISVKNGSASSKTFTNEVLYLYTELYSDSDGVAHETAGSQQVKFAAGAVVASYGITFTIPARTNTFATNYAIYRSVDEVGGGYPNMYKVGTAIAADTPVTWTDDFSVPIESTATDPVNPTNVDVYPIYNVLTFTGQTEQFELTPPPPAKLALPFQGCMVYVPSDTSLARRLYFSLPSTISPTAIEQVPPINYLEFATAKNDSIVAIAMANGGNNLMVFFHDYTMSVGLLPQASDPGVFDNRVKEYVTNVRGAAGRLTVCEFTLPSGETLVAAVDRLGVWRTNGTSTMEEWSRDLDWNALMNGVDLSTAELYNNPIKRRLELVYYSGGYKELHFFYARIKQDGDGREAPLITGPHPIGIRSHLYTLVGNAYVGFGGDATAGGKVFREAQGDADASNGYDGTGTIPFVVTPGDLYLGGLGRSHLCEFGYPKFTTEVFKDVTATGVFITDVGGSRTITQTFAAGGMKKLWWHAYADRHRITFSDITPYACPALVGYEVEVRDTGVAREK